MERDLLLHIGPPMLTVIRGLVYGSDAIGVGLSHWPVTGLAGGGGGGRGGAGGSGGDGGGLGGRVCATLYPEATPVMRERDSTVTDASKTWQLNS